MGDQRRLILNAAAELFRDVGYERATLDSIGEIVGLSKTSLYYYVRSKEELLARLLGTVIEEIALQAKKGLSATASAEERLHHFLRAHVEVVRGNPTGILLARHQDVVLGEAHSRSMREARHRHEKHLEKILEQGVAERRFRSVNVRRVAYLILGALNSVSRWHAHSSPASHEEIADELFSLVTGGIRRSGSIAPRRRNRRAK